MKLVDVLSKIWPVQPHQPGFMLDQEPNPELISVYQKVHGKSGQTPYLQHRVFGLTGDAVLLCVCEITREENGRVVSAKLSIDTYPLRYLVFVQRAYSIQLTPSGSAEDSLLQIGFHFEQSSGLRSLVIPPPDEDRNNITQYEAFCKAAMAISESFTNAAR